MSGPTNLPRLRLQRTCVLGADEGEEREERLRHLVTDWLHNVLTPGLFAFGSLVGLNNMRRSMKVDAVRGGAS